MNAMVGLRIAEDLTLPAEAVTQTFGILAKRGVGKTYTASVMVEEMIKAGLPVVIIDPLGAWHGLRSSADSQGPGLPVVILGGRHGDIPLEPTAGELVADLLVDSPTPMILDLSGMRKGQARTFVTDFLERLYQRNEDPLHVVLDEADLWAPQRPLKGAERLLGAVEDLVRRGRGKGLGVTQISQRPAVIHKDVLTQIEVLVVLRITSPQDRAAIDDWIRHHEVPAERAELLASLAKLPVGTAWWWSPGWLDIFMKVRVRRRETYDSSATPKVGERRREPKAMADVDLEALKVAMAATIERAQADDPKLLRRRIAQLERQLADVEPEPVPVPVLDVEVLARLEQLLNPVRVLVDEIRARIATVPPGPPGWGGRRPAEPRPDMAERMPTICLSCNQAIPFAEYVEHRRHCQDDITAANQQLGADLPASEVQARVDELREQIARGGAGDGPKLGKAERRVLGVLVQFPAGRSRVQLALLSGYSIRSSSLSNALGTLRSAGYVTPGGEPIQATAEGIAAAGPVEPLPTGAELYRFWCSRLGRAERAVLDVLVEAWPDPVNRDELAKRSGYSATSSSLSNALGKLRSLELVDGWRASDDLMTTIS